MPPSTLASAWKAGPGDVVQRLLRGQGRAAGLDVGAQGHGARVLGAVLVTQDSGPQPSQCAVLGSFLEEVVLGVEYPRNLAGKVVDGDATRQHRVDVGQRVGDCKSHLLRGRAARVADVVATDADRVPARRLARTPGHRVGGQTHAGTGREDVGATRHVFLEDVVLDGAAQPAGRHALLLASDDDHGQQHSRRRH